MVSDAFGITVGADVGCVVGSASSLFSLFLFGAEDVLEGLHVEGWMMAREKGGR